MNGSRMPEPTQLVRIAKAASKGDARAAGQLMDALGPTILRVIRQVLGNHHPEVEDVAQETAVETLQTLPAFRWQCTIAHFVWRVAALTAMNARRKLRVHEQTLPSGADLDDWASSDPSPATQMFAARRRDHCRRLLDELLGFDGVSDSAAPPRIGTASTR